MNRTLTLLAAGGSGLALGWAAISLLGKDASPVPKLEIPDAQVPPPSGRDEASARRHDFATLKRSFQRGLFLPPDAARAIERMSTGDLRRLLAEPWETGNVAERTVLASAREAAARELFGRDAEGNLKWAEGLGAEGRGTLLLLVKTAATEEPRFAKPWIDRLGADEGPQWRKEMARASLTGAMGRGADAVLEIEEIFDEDTLRSLPMDMGEFDAGFDFGRLVEATGIKDLRSKALRIWAAGDREAAFQAALAKLSSEGLDAQGLPGIAFSGVASMSGEAEAAAWIAGKLEGIPQDLRGRVAGTLSHAEMPSVARVEALMKALPSDADRIEFLAGHYSPFSHADPMLAGLRMLGSQELQADALRTTAGRYRMLMEINPKQGERVVERFEQTMQALGLPEEVRAEVRAGYAPEVK